MSQLIMVFIFGSYTKNPLSVAPSAKVIGPATHLGGINKAQSTPSKAAMGMIRPLEILFIRPPPDIWFEHASAPGSQALEIFLCAWMPLKRLAFAIPDRNGPRGLG